MMTLRDNVIKAVRHEQTLWVPNSYTDIDLTLQSSLNERYEGQTMGNDEFGVSYTYSEAAGAPIVTPGTCVLPDIAEWKELVKFPDVDNYDWEAGAKRDTVAWDRENKFSVVMLFNGPFERLHALMGFEEGLICIGRRTGDRKRLYCRLSGIQKKNDKKNRRIL